MQLHGMMGSELPAACVTGGDVSELGRLAQMPLGTGSSGRW